MGDIPDRENLESMSRPDIQKLCKDNNIKANMRTDEMINALCDLANGKDVPRPHRSQSQRPPSQPPPTSRRSSVQPRVVSKVTTVSSTKQPTVQPSVLNTGAESITDVPVSAPPTRRKAKDIQVHLGKGRPVVAGGTGARNITKALSGGAGRRTKASVILHEEPILEEEEGAEALGTPKDDVANAEARPSSVRPLSPSHQVTSELPVRQPSQPPTPNPAQPSHPLSSSQLSALEARIAQLEIPGLAARVLQMEASVADLSTLKAALAQISTLQAEIKRLESSNDTFTTELAQWTKAHLEMKTRTTGLEAQVQKLVVKNDALKQHVEELEVKLREIGGNTSTTSVLIHSPKSQKTAGSWESAEVAPHAVTVSEKLVLANPSPSQPTLGKRGRSETPDASLMADGGVLRQHEDTDREAIYRVTRPQRKKARLNLDADEDTPDFSLFDRDPSRPSSTSTPRRGRSNSPGFFTAGCRAPTSLTKDDKSINLHLDSEELTPDEVKTTASDVIEKPSSVRTSNPIEAGPCTPPSRGLVTPVLEIPSEAEPLRDHVEPMHDPGFFGGPLPVYYRQGSELPYPLRPPTPLNAQDVLEKSAQLAAPTLGEPWKYHATTNPTTTSLTIEAERLPVSSGSHSTASGPIPSSSTATVPEDPGNYTFRAGGRRERNDKYNPYFTPQRGPGARHRTGLTPARGFSISLKSPAKMTKIPENAADDVDVTESNDEVNEDKVERSPPQLRTLYGTELEGDTRFGDYGRDIGRFDWRKYIPQ